MPLPLLQSLAFDLTVPGLFIYSICFLWVVHGVLSPFFSPFGACHYRGR